MDSNRWKRFDDWDARALRLDKFAAEDPENGFSAFAGKADPKPGLTIENGAVTAMDGVPAAGFDMIDAFIAETDVDVIPIEPISGLLQRVAVADQQGGEPVHPEVSGFGGVGGGGSGGIADDRIIARDLAEADDSGAGDRTERTGDDGEG